MAGSSAPLIRGHPQVVPCVSGAGRRLRRPRRRCHGGGLCRAALVPALRADRAPGARKLALFVRQGLSCMGLDQAESLVRRRVAPGRGRRTGHPLSPPEGGADEARRRYQRSARAALSRIDTPNTLPSRPPNRASCEAIRSQGNEQAKVARRPQASAREAVRGSGVRRYCAAACRARVDC